MDGPDAIYRYLKENPEYKPNKFDIVGESRPDFKYDEYKKKIGSYYGGGEYEIDDEELNNISTDDLDMQYKIIAVGAMDPHENDQSESHYIIKSASTVEQNLRELFGPINLDHVKKQSRRHHTCKGGMEFKSKPPRDECSIDTEPRFCDISDEILYSCPNYDGANDSSDIETSDEASDEASDDYDDMINVEKNVESSVEDQDFNDYIEKQPEDENEQLENNDKNMIDTPSPPKYKSNTYGIYDSTGVLLEAILHNDDIDYTLAGSLKNKKDNDYINDNEPNDTNIMDFLD